MQVKVSVHLEKTNEIFYQQLSYAESKNYTLSGVLSVLIFGVSTIGNELELFTKPIFRETVILIIISFVIALIISLSSFVPNLNVMNKKDQKNHYFFGDVSTFKNGEEYIESINKNKDFDLQLAEQNIIISKIILKKNKKFRLALYFCIPLYFIFYPFSLFVKKIKLKRKLR